MTLADRPPLPPEATALYGPPKITGPTPRNNLADAIRRVIDLTVGRPIGDDDLARAAVAVEAVADTLARGAEKGKRPRGQPNASEHPQDYFPTSPMAGPANPIAPPVDVWAVRGEGGQLELRGRAFFGYAYEGPPTCVHGGVIAELFDELLGSANIITGRAGMTGTLTVRYRKPTPLLSELALVARQTGSERRKIFAWGGVYFDGELTAEAEGVFIELDPNRMMNIVTANAGTAQGDVVDPQLRAFVEAGGQILGAEGTITAGPPTS
jgi:hypothetical protein